MEKIIKDGKVAILYSPGYGAGWSTWNPDDRETLCMDARIVQHVLNEDIDSAIKVTEELFPGTYLGGAEDLKVEWLPIGTAFEILEYDGSESIRVISNIECLVA